MLTEEQRKEFEEEKSRQRIVFSELFKAASQIFEKEAAKKDAHPFDAAISAFAMLESYIDSYE